MIIRSIRRLVNHPIFIIGSSTVLAIGMCIGIVCLDGLCNERRKQYELDKQAKVTAKEHKENKEKNDKELFEQTTEITFEDYKKIKERQQYIDSLDKLEFDSLIKHCLEDNIISRAEHVVIIQKYSALLYARVRFYENRRIETTKLDIRNSFDK